MNDTWLVLGVLVHCIALKAIKIMVNERDKCEQNILLLEKHGVGTYDRRWDVEWVE